MNGRKIVRASVSILAVITMLAVLLLVNRAYRMIDLSTISVSSGPGVQAPVRVYRGFHSINADNDNDALGRMSGWRLVYDGFQSALLNTDYGENDFLITAGGDRYFITRHFLFNNRYQHSYTVQIDSMADGTHIRFKAEGPNSIDVHGRMSSVPEAKHRRWNRRLPSRE